MSLNPIQTQESESQRLLLLTMLYDFYSDLLTEKQRAFFDMYHFQDLSLNEISGELNITAQAVRDLIKRTEKNLLDYENRLGLFERHKLLKLKLLELWDMAEGFTGLSEPEKTALKKGLSELLN